MTSNLNQRSYGKGWIPDEYDHNDKLLGDLYGMQRLDPKEVYQIISDKAQKRTKFTLEDSCPPVYQQLDLGSCVANATAAALRFAWRNSAVNCSSPYEDFDPSRLWIYYYARLLANNRSDLAFRDTGCQIRDALKVLQKKGVCTETAWPYLDEAESKAVLNKQQDENDRDAMPDDCRAGIIPAMANDDNIKSFFDFGFDYHRIRSLTDVDSSSTDADTVIDQMCACLSEGFPIIFGFAMYNEADGKTDEFNDERNWSDNAFMVQIDRLEDRVSPTGGHAVLCVGFDRSRKMFRIMNSWGTSWGDKGFFWLPFSWFEKADNKVSPAYDLWTIRPHLAPLLRDHDPVE